VTKISWKSSLMSHREAQEPSDTEGLKATLLAGPESRVSDESRVRLTDKAQEAGMEEMIKEPIYFMNLHTLPYMSPGMHVAPELGIDSE
jgi:hypothetical protein